MQTFLPLADFDECARVLDASRLGNQYYREGITILRGGWPHHPASRMWANNRDWLCAYLLSCDEELERRGHSYPHIRSEVLRTLSTLRRTDRPWWIGDERLHASHRANLLRKDPTHYGQFGWTEAPREGYFWPTHHEALRLFINSFKETHV